MSQASVDWLPTSTRAVRRRVLQSRCPGSPGLWTSRQLMREQQTMQFAQVHVVAADLTPPAYKRSADVLRRSRPVTSCKKAAAKNNVVMARAMSYLGKHRSKHSLRTTNSHRTWSSWAFNAANDGICQGFVSSQLSQPMLAKGNSQQPVSRGQARTFL